MTAFRLISLSTHSVIELVVGFALMVAPFALGFGPGAMVASVVLGILVTGLALGGIEDLPIGIHAAADYALVLALTAGSAALTLSGDPVAAPVFLAGGLMLLVLALITRYSRGPITH